MEKSPAGLYDYWVDGSDDNGYRAWQFSDGSDMPLGSPFWDLEYHRPSGGMDASCVALQGSRDYYWRDFPCDYLKPGLCVCGEGRLKLSCCKTVKENPLRF